MWIDRWSLRALPLHAGREAGALPGFDAADQVGDAVVDRSTIVILADQIHIDNFAGDQVRGRERADVCERQAPSNRTFWMKVRSTAKELAKVAKH